MNRIAPSGIMTTSFAICCLVACESSDTITVPVANDGDEVTSVPAEAATLSYTPVSEATTQVSAIGERERLVIRSLADWESYWGRFAAAVIPTPATPAVDFGVDAVVAVAMGGRPTGGYGISVREVRGDAAGIYIVVVESSPGATCIVTQATTAPATAIRVTADSRPIQFVEETETLECS
ncbi:MAG: protease complex subunit PrcB family protein [Longimicrobiales bacterium]